MRRSVVFLVLALLVIAGLSNSEPEKKEDVLSGKIEGLIIDNMMTDKLELVDGVEVVVSHIVIPPNTELPKHWHHGEEYGFILEGSLLLWQKDKPEMKMNEGELAKIPLRQVHTVRSLDEGATILVFRIHEEGQPVRVLEK